MCARVFADFGPDIRAFVCEATKATHQAIVLSIKLKESKNGTESGCFWGAMIFYAPTFDTRVPKLYEADGPILEG